MGKVKIYISGPIAHYDLHERKHAFLMAKERLESQGYDPVNPFDNGVPDNAHWREHMRADIAMLLKIDPYNYLRRCVRSYFSERKRERMALVGTPERRKGQITYDEIMEML